MVFEILLKLISGHCDYGQPTIYDLAVLMESLIKESYESILVNKHALNAVLFSKLILGLCDWLCM